MLRDWGDFVHLNHIVEAGVPGFTMITPYENATAAIRATCTSTSSTTPRPRSRSSGCAHWSRRASARGTRRSARRGRCTPRCASCTSTRSRGSARLPDSFRSHARSTAGERRAVAGFPYDTSTPRCAVRSGSPGSRSTSSGGIFWRIREGSRESIARSGDGHCLDGPGGLALDRQLHRQRAAPDRDRCERDGDPRRRARGRRQPGRARHLPGGRRWCEGCGRVHQQQGWRWRDRGTKARRRLHRLETCRRCRAKRRDHRVRK